MPDDPENPIPQPVRGRPLKPEEDQLVKVVSYIPKKLLPLLDAMAAGDGRTRASMISRILQAMLAREARGISQGMQDIDQLKQSLEELRERMQKILSEVQEKKKKEGS